MQRPTFAQIDLEHLAFNFHSVKSFVGRDLQYLAVVKADAYGHGAVKCAKHLEGEGVDWFGVALPEEGVELRKNGITKPILCLGGFWVGQEESILDYSLTTVICHLKLAEKLNQAALRRDEIVDVHLKIDTGMNRIGVRWDELDDFAEGLKEFTNLRVSGVMTHFASADNLAQTEFTNIQISRFNDAVKLLQKKGFTPVIFDLANSPASVAHPQSRGNMVRLGGVLYGLGGDILPKEIAIPELKAVLSLYSKIAYLKKVRKGESLGYSASFTVRVDSLIAAIPIGYHDGYPRLLSNKSRVIINGEYANVVGRVSMDWILVDVSHLKDVEIADDVIIIGTDGQKSVKTEELSGLIGTISYEITCGINERVPKRFVN